MARDDNRTGATASENDRGHDDCDGYGGDSHRDAMHVLPAGAFNMTRARSRTVILAAADFAAGNAAGAAWKYFL